MLQESSPAHLLALADAALALHFAWILFMISGAVLAAAAFRYGRLFEMWLFRSVHLLGIVYVGALGVLGRPCPLTLVENALRAEAGAAAYPGSFMAWHLGRLVYPDVGPLMIMVPTLCLAAFTAAVYALRPPQKVRELFRRPPPRRREHGE